MGEHHENICGQRRHWTDVAHDEMVETRRWLRRIKSFFSRCHVRGCWKRHKHGVIADTWSGRWSRQCPFHLEAGKVYEQDEAPRSYLGCVGQG